MISRCLRLVHFGSLSTYRHINDSKLLVEATRRG